MDGAPPRACETMKAGIFVFALVLAAVPLAALPAEAAQGSIDASAPQPVADLGVCWNITDLYHGSVYLCNGPSGVQ